ncbi:MAG: hypothetical protein GDA49_07095 [Rhodospirillales bacterium]|nr:hypothetical protein [Rhodospirillales bacterium]
MAYELKNWFDPAFFEDLASALADAHKGFDRASFVAAACEGLGRLSIMERLQRTADLCAAHLPDDYATALAVVSVVAPRYEGHFRASFGPEFVARYGRGDRKRSMKALKSLTRYGSAEFAVRHFFLDDPNDTLKHMRAWAKDRNHHVRRLASEGSRPRLPWSPIHHRRFPSSSRSGPIPNPMFANRSPTISTTSARIIPRPCSTWSRAGTGTMSTRPGSCATPAEA